MGSGFWGFFKNNNKLISNSFSSQAKAILILTFLLGCWRDTLPLPCQLPMNSNHSFTGFCSALTSSQAHVNTTGLISRGTEHMKSNAKSQWQTDNKRTRRQSARILMLLIYLFIPLTGIRQKTLAFLEETTWKPQCVCWSSIQTMCQLTAVPCCGWMMSQMHQFLSKEKEIYEFLSLIYILIYLFYTKGSKLLFQPALAISQIPDQPRNQIRKETRCRLAAASRGPVPTLLFSESEN